MASAFYLTVINDFRLLWNTPSLLAVAVGAKVLHLVGNIFFLVCLHRTNRPQSHHRLYAFALAVLVVVMAATTLTRLPYGEFQGPAFGLSATICVVYFAQRGPLWYRTTAGIALGIMALLFLWHPKLALTPTGRVTGSIGVVVLNVAGAYAVQALEEQRRKRFDVQTELVRKIRELAAEKERAEAMSRTRTAFLAAMSHEFRTPMNAVIGLSDLLLDAPLSAENKEHVQAISDSSRALLTLLNDILDFAKFDAEKVNLDPAPFDLRKLLSSVVDMMQPVARRRSVNLTMDVGKEIPPGVLGDEARLRQVLVNLLSNAVKFTEKGRVRVRISGLRQGDKRHAVRIQVEDSGIGMTPEVVARLFRPFVQADGSITRHYGGTGLGLAISRQIVVAMGGDIQVESAPGKGSTFSFELKLDEVDVPPQSSPSSVPKPQKNLPPLAILVVDDLVVNQRVAKAGFARLGYKVDLANDGNEAIALVSKKEYDVIFVDLQMPGMSGLETTAHIQEMFRGKKMPHLVAMTASVFEEDREACRKAGMVDFIGKPIDLLLVSALLSRLSGSSVEVANLAKEPLAMLRQVETLGEAGFFESVCRLFLEDAPRQAGQMQEAFLRSAEREVEHLAHSLKSTSATLGATELSNLCAQIEKAARTGQLTEIQEVLSSLPAKLKAVERALRRELGEDVTT